MAAEGAKFMHNAGDVFFILLKAFAMLCQIVCESFVFMRQVIQGVPEVHRMQHEGSGNMTEGQYPEYVRAAYSFSIFYVLGILYTLGYWVMYARSKRRDDLPVMGTLVLFFCNMPVLVSDMFMLKSRGELNWDQQGADVILQIVFCVNAIVHVYMNLYTACEVKGGFSYVIVFALSCLSMCCLYTPVTWAMVGWQWLGAVDLHEVVGLHVTDKAHRVVAVFILLGNIGQFIIAAVIVMMLYSHFSCTKEPPKSSSQMSHTNAKPPPQGEKPPLVIPEVVVT